MIKAVRAYDNYLGLPLNKAGRLTKAARGRRVRLFTGAEAYINHVAGRTILFSTKYGPITGVIGHIIAVLD